MIEVLFTFWFAAVLIWLWLAPAHVAYHRHHRNRQAIVLRLVLLAGILALDFFLGWTVIGWVAALVWALTNDTMRVPA
jgi:hypothetical protein